MKLQEIMVASVIEVSPDETIGAATARLAFAVGRRLNVQGSTFRVQGVQWGR